MKTAFKDLSVGGIEGEPYILFLEFLHKTLEPESYFEIGTSTGTSLARSKCASISVDPFYQIDKNVLSDRETTFFFQMGSDQFFKKYDLKSFFPSGPDLCFLDGMHRVEFLLRDFINTEKASHRRTLVAMHDCLPLNRRMAERNVIHGSPDEAFPDAWTGDVWKIIPILRARRPDLRIHYVDTPPTGLVLVSNLNPEDDTLSREYYDIIDNYLDLELDESAINSLYRDCATIDSRKVMADPHLITALFSLF